MRRNAIDLVLLAVVLAGGVLAWQAGRERARLAAHHDRLVAAAGELPVDDPTLIYLKALDTGDPLHFAWRVHVPANAAMEVRCKVGHGSSGSGWSSSTPTDFIARVRLREDEQGLVNVYVKSLGSSSRSSTGNAELARLLRERNGELKAEQVGKPNVATLDPKAKKPTVLLRVAAPVPRQEKLSPDLAPFFPDLVELMVGPTGTLP